MKLQKRFLRKYKDKNYYKYIINLPPEIIEELGLKEGDELEVIIEKGEVKLIRK
jgi:AbrB family looped-hinge helix DNA binding protein